MSAQITLKCAICQTCASLEDDQSWGALYSCGHVFHEDCVAKALVYKKECPICRAPAKRPERDKQAHQHRIYLPLAPQSAPDPSQNPDTIATPGCLLVTSGEYSAKITEAEDLRKEVKELQASIKEEARKLETATAALLEESKKLRVQELEADEQRDKAEEERAKLAEDVLVKERELKKLREEKHTMKSQLEQQANFYKGKAVREEREKNQLVKEVATLQLQLDKELGAKDMAALAKNLRASSKEEDATVPLQNALQLRNEQYRHLLLQKKKLDSDRRELASKVADQRRELHQLKMDLKASAQAAVTPAQQQQLQGSRGGRQAPIPYNTPEEDMLPVRLPVADRPGAHAHRSSSGAARACEAADAEVLLDDGDDGGPDAAWAAEFAARARAPAGSQVDRQAASAGAGRPHAVAAESPGEDGGCAQEQLQMTSEAAPRTDAYDGGMACSIQNDSPDSDEWPAWDEEEERLLEQWEGTAVDVSVSVDDVSAMLNRVPPARHSSQGAECPGSQPTSGSDPGKQPSHLSRLGGTCNSAAAQTAGPAGRADAGGGKENLQPQAQPQHALGVQLARRWQTDAGVASAASGMDEAAIRSQESSRQPPARKRLKRLYSPDPGCGEPEPPAEPVREEATFDLSDDVIDLDCDADDDIQPGAPDWCQDAQPISENEVPRLSPRGAAFGSVAAGRESSAGAGVRSSCLGSGQQLSGESLGTSSLRSHRDSESSRWKQSFSHASSSLGLGVGKGRGSFLDRKPGSSSGGPNGEFVRRGADGKGGRTTVLKMGSLQLSGGKRPAWSAVSHFGPAAPRNDVKRRSEKARSAHGTASIAQYFNKGPKS